eukprot:TRINITY_DN33743_c0_g1_i1.p2 TRINITY_DN33743_c0_g1~~TRINITY_DN33743_c0_g1_i1.p2  ORF type:complete len:154 (+),score=43.49 TRINITY_DN33743_c0_g1_i1:20-481(+)
MVDGPLSAARPAPFSPGFDPQPRSPAESTTGSAEGVAPAGGALPLASLTQPRSAAPAARAPRRAQEEPARGIGPVHKARVAQSERGHLSVARVAAAAAARALAAVRQKQRLAERGGQTKRHASEELVQQLLERKLDSVTKERDVLRRQTAELL